MNWKYIWESYKSERHNATINQIKTKIKICKYLFTIFHIISMILFSFTIFIYIKTGLIGFTVISIGVGLYIEMIAIDKLPDERNLLTLLYLKQLEEKHVENK